MWACIKNFFFFFCALISVLACLRKFWKWTPVAGSITIEMKLGNAEWGGMQAGWLWSWLQPLLSYFLLFHPHLCRSVLTNFRLSLSSLARSRTDSTVSRWTRPAVKNSHVITLKAEPHFREFDRGQMGGYLSLLGATINRESSLTIFYSDKKDNLTGSQKTIYFSSFLIKTIE